MIPIFRAKKLDSDEYVEGYLLHKFENNYYISLEWSMDSDGYTPDFVKIDISTLSIHFPDMLDRLGNKIFASLQEDGKDGDILFMQHCYIVSFDGLNFNLESLFLKTQFNKHDSWKNFKIVGIQQ